MNSRIVLAYYYSSCSEQLGSCGEYKRKREEKRGGCENKEKRDEEEERGRGQDKRGMRGRVE